MKTASNILLIAICFIIPVGVFGQVDTAAEAADSPGAGADGVSEDSFDSPLNGDSTMVLDDSDTITVDFPNEEIRTVLRNVAEFYDLNIVIPAELEGTTSIKLRDVNWRQIFEVILNPVGFTYIEEGNIIQVVSQDALNFEPPVNEIYIINYADANAISGTINNMVDQSAGGRVQVDTRTNSLIVTERPSKMSSIGEVIQRLDRPTQQVMIETKFVEVTNRNLENIGIDWSSLKEYNGSISYSDEAVVTPPKLALDSNGNVILDPLERAVVEATSFNGIRKLISTGEDGIQRVSRALFSGDEFAFTLNLLQEVGDARLVSNPTVVTMNNEEATIAIGEQYPIPNYAYNEERGQFVVNGFEYKDIGVILKVKPSVNSNGLINLTVEPEVSTLTGTSTFDGAEIPIVATRNTKTQIALQDGFTMGLGGLMESSSNSTNSKVPVFGDIPVLGRAFRNKEANGTKLNLLIFITAKILPVESTNYEDVFTDEAISDAGVDPDELRNR